MAKDAEKQATPAYVSYKTLTSFLNGIREVNHVPAVIDRSAMSKLSGATQNEIMAALKFLKMTNEKGEPSSLFSEYTLADDAARKTMLPKMVRDSYDFVFNTPNFDINRATSNQVAELFRLKGVNGSTNSRAISFFLSMVKEAGLPVSPHVKAPPIVRNGGAKPKKAKSAQQPEVNSVRPGENNDPPPPPGAEILDIPIPINRKVRIMLPADFKTSDWDLFKTMLEAYIVGWKAEKASNGS